MINNSICRSCEHYVTKKTGCYESWFKNTGITPDDINVDNPCQYWKQLTPKYIKEWKDRIDNVSFRVIGDNIICESKW